MKKVLDAMMNKANHPVLVHCLKGKVSLSLNPQHRVGCLVGCLRKYQGWSLSSIFDEYRRFSGVKLRIADQEASRISLISSLLRHFNCKSVIHIQVRFRISEAFPYS
jgi:tyrosine-protein phosphatase SIW14